MSIDSICLDAFGDDYEKWLTASNFDLYFFGENLIEITDQTGAGNS